MPKREKALPWAASEGARKETYPRRNLYFTGQDDAELYDWCVWRSQVEGYDALEGAVRGSPDIIIDLILRRFLQDMLDEKVTERFEEWRRQEYEKAGLDSLSAKLMLANRYFPSAELERRNPRYAALMRQRCSVSRAQREALWNRQEGRCGICSQTRPMKIYARRLESPLYDDPDFARLVAICEFCIQFCKGEYMAVPKVKVGRPRREPK